MGEIVLITGANGEVGHSLIPALAEKDGYSIFALDVLDLDESLKPFVQKFFKISILQENAVIDIFNKNKITSVFHLAGVLSTAAERSPEIAQSVNAGGTAILLNIANGFAQKDKQVIKFIFPSTIAVYGIPDLETKTRAGKVKENQFQKPITMYGINKLYCEMLGNYYSTNYKMLENNKNDKYLDFRCLRFPGLISAITLPTGGTSDYGSEMVHSAAKGEGYESFVRSDTTLPFMVMPDAVKALVQLSEAPKVKLSQSVYNVGSFSISAEEISQIVNGAFPDSSISYSPDNNRQRIVDSWPQSLDDSKARQDWNWRADYDVEKSFNDYLIPVVQNRYAAS